MGFMDTQKAESVVDIRKMANAIVFDRQQKTRETVTAEAISYVRTLVSNRIQFQVNFESNRIEFTFNGSVHSEAALRCLPSKALDVSYFHDNFAKIILEWR